MQVWFVVSFRGSCFKSHYAAGLLIFNLRPFEHHTDTITPYIIVLRPELIL